MRLLPHLLALIATTSLGLAEEDAPKKRGGFTGATPKPAAKKKAKPAADSDEDTKPTTKSATPKPETTPSSKKKVASEDAAAPSKTPAATPAPKTYDTEDNGASAAKPERAPAATVAPEEIAEFAAQPPKVQALITAALELTKLNLTYSYGSADPAQGGMDCSGTMYHLLRAQGFKDVPRDSSSQYVWARKAGPFFAVVSKSADSFEFKDLQPGDLLFWTGTYETGREIPISHVMLYLGTEKKTKKRIMFGASDGRSYNGVQRWGVSVFDFKMPRVDPANPEKSKVDFVGYGRIPSLREAGVAEGAAEPAVKSTDSVPEEPLKTKRNKPGVRSKKGA